MNTGLDELKKLRDLQQSTTSGSEWSSPSLAGKSVSSGGAGPGGMGKTGRGVVGALTQLGASSIGLGPVKGVASSLVDSLITDKSAEETWDRAKNSLVDAGINFATSSLGPARGVVSSLISSVMSDKSPDEMRDSALRSVVNTGISMAIPGAAVPLAAAKALFDFDLARGISAMFDDRDYAKFGGTKAGFFNDASEEYGKGIRYDSEDASPSPYNGYGEGLRISNADPDSSANADSDPYGGYGTGLRYSDNYGGNYNPYSGSQISLNSQLSLSSQPSSDDGDVAGDGEDYGGGYANSQANAEAGMGSEYSGSSPSDSDSNSDSESDSDSGYKGGGKVSGPLSRLAEQGRNGDTRIAHLTPGEAVIPRELVESNPELMRRLEEILYSLGGTPEELYVGQGRVNPRTGVEEFATESEVRAAYEGIGRANPDAEGLQYWMDNGLANFQSSASDATAKANASAMDQAYAPQAPAANYAANQDAASVHPYTTPTYSADPTSTYGVGTGLDSSLYDADAQNRFKDSVIRSAYNELGRSNIDQEGLDYWRSMATPNILGVAGGQGLRNAILASGRDSTAQGNAAAIDRAYQQESGYAPTSGFKSVLSNETPTPLAGQLSNGQRAYDKYYAGAGNDVLRDSYDTWSHGIDSLKVYKDAGLAGPEGSYSGPNGSWVPKSGATDTLEAKQKRVAALKAAGLSDTDAFIAADNGFWRPADDTTIPWTPDMQESGGMNWNTGNTSANNTTRKPIKSVLRPTSGGAYRGTQWTPNGWSASQHLRDAADPTGSDWWQNAIAQSDIPGQVTPLTPYARGGQITGPLMRLRRG